MKGQHHTQLLTAIGINKRKGFLIAYTLVEGETMTLGHGSWNSSYKTWGFKIDMGRHLFQINRRG